MRHFIIFCILFMNSLAFGEDVFIKELMNELEKKSIEWDNESPKILQDELGLSSYQIEQLKSLQNAYRPRFDFLAQQLQKKHNPLNSAQMATLMDLYTQEIASVVGIENAGKIEILRQRFLDTSDTIKNAKERNKIYLDIDHQKPAKNGGWLQGGLRVPEPKINIAIQGDGFFVLKDQERRYFSRYGAFYIDNLNILRQESTMHAVMGFKDQQLQPIEIPTTVDNDLRKETANKYPAYAYTLNENFFVLEKLTVGANGLMVAHYSTGKTLEIGHIALANFKNPRKLMRLYAHSLIANEDSCSPEIGYPQSQGFGMIFNDALEELDNYMYQINLDL